ncbi:hypothetical protein [Defluviimonas salinarum]|uniref:Tyrosine specific protein phosphatases domain-containing protein n=1 Tax=Defluviimonas salinarum TaxID=2992147 RepID=A0ABT3J9I3_9RHOB|nr:hypothetical protein [Defluviimonas salinarum]MCW3784320.1 hypothetical protein [Defluviimonas salinarum]
MTAVVITGIYGLARALERTRPDLVISITDPDDIFDPGSRDPARARIALAGVDCPVLSLAFHDVDQVLRDFIAPTLEDGRKVIAAVDAHLPGDGGTLLVHCHLGMSRSPAVALLALGHVALRREPGSADLAGRVADAVYAAAPGAMPNMRVVGIAERLLDGFDGALHAEVRKHNTRVRASQEDQPFTW